MIWDLLISNITKAISSNRKFLKKWVIKLSIIFFVVKSYITHFIKNKRKLVAQEKNLSLTLNQIVIKLLSRLNLLI